MLRFGLYVIGDEILSGRRTDRHLAHVIALLRDRGLLLCWAHFLPDDRTVLEQAFRHSLASDDVVFSCGGIGATPDDHTRQAAANALGADLVLHPGARDEIAQVAAKRGLHDLSSPEGQQVLKMGEFPRGARLVPNPYNRIPGFAVARHYFLPGFPVMAWPMIEWVLETEFREHFYSAPQTERSLLLFAMPESAVTPLMQETEARFAGVRTFSLPSVGDGADGRPTRRHIELGVKGPPALAEQAFEYLRAQLQAKGAQIELAATAPSAITNQ